MFISTISKHLPAVITYVQTPIGDCLLEVVHLVESARYHLHNLDRLTSGAGNAPQGFQAGVDFKGVVLDSHWRIMTSLIEFEAFLASAKRCLDRAWCCVGPLLGKETARIRTLGGAVYDLTRKVKDKSVLEVLEHLTYFNILKNAWFEWGSELADLRNYVEHQAPFGGRSFGYTQQTQEGEIIKIFIPDEVPSGKADVPKRELTFNKQITANVYGHQTIAKLDILVTSLLNQRDVLKYVEL